MSEAGGVQEHYKVVVNHEEQYALWAAGRDNPPGWRDAGKEGSREECLDYIETVWTDMRPLSLRVRMENPEPVEPPPYEGPETEEGELVLRLAAGSHRVSASRAGGSAARLQESLERGYVHLKFEETRGGTEVGVRLDRGASEWHQADFAACRGTIHLEGELTLDFIPVRCMADIELSTLTGSGRLAILGSGPGYI